MIKDFGKFQNRSQLLTANNRDSQNEEYFSCQLISLKNERWKEIRRIITPSFTTSKMKSIFQVMSGAIDSLMNIIERKSNSIESFDIYELYGRLTMDVIGRTAFGIQTDVQNNSDEILLNAAKIIFENKFYSFFNIITTSFPEFHEIWKIFKNIRFYIKAEGRNPFLKIGEQVKEIIKIRRTSKMNQRQDLLQIMMDAKISKSELDLTTNADLTIGDIRNENENVQSEKTKRIEKKLLRMTDHEIVDNSLLFFLAGYETTSTTLAFITHFLIYYPEIQERVRDEIQEVIGKEKKIDYNSVQQLKYMEQVIMESLRMYPPAYLFVNRIADENVVYDSYHILKGMKIEIPVYNVNHDPELWPDPETFDPNRFSQENKCNINPIAFQGFGAGPRNCIGMRFALLEIKLTLARLLNDYILIRTEETDKNPITLMVKPIMITPAKGIMLKAISIK